MYQAFLSFLLWYLGLPLWANALLLCLVIYLMYKGSTKNPR